MTRRVFILLLVCAMFLISCKSYNSVKPMGEKTEYGKPLDVKEDLQKLKEYKKYLSRTRYENSSIILTSVGDIMVGRRVGRILEAKGTDLAYRNLKEVFDRSDILFGNLECPISDRGRKILGKEICLRAKPEMIEVLEKPGFNIVSLANNHILDYDTEALLDTFDILKENNIGYIGAGKDIEEARKPYIIKAKGKTFAFLGYNEFAHIYYSNSYKRSFAAADNLPGTVPLELNSVLEDVRRIRNDVDYVIISLHWGNEDSNNITSEQMKFAHSLIENGVDIILGHHPHVIQPIEIYKGKPILYSMGNYVFDQNDENNKQGMVAEISIEYGKIKEVGIIPIYIQNKSEPIIAVDKKGNYIRNKIIKLSKKVGTLGEIKENKVIFTIN